MKKLIYLIALLPLFTSCEDIGEDDRYIETGPVEVSRKVLLEEFTGQRCTNCPDAHKIIESLEAQYGDNLIAVSIHAGNFGVKAPAGLKQEEGDIYANHWKIPAYPMGVIDRNSGVMGMNDWASVIRKDLESSTDLELSLEAQVSEDGSNIEVFTTMVGPDNLSGSLQLWVVESNIVAFQINGSVTLQDYVHNNVFRTCVNGIWGEEIPLTANVVKYVSNTVAIDEKWNLENTAIVGFYYNDSGVIQVDRCSVKLADMAD